MKEEKSLEQIETNLLEMAKEYLPFQISLELEGYIKATSSYRKNEFQVLKSFRRFFVKSRKKNIVYISYGGGFFEYILDKNICDRSLILFHRAYFHEYYHNSILTDETVKKSWDASKDKMFLLPWITDLYSHMIENKVSNDNDITQRFDALIDSLNVQGEEWLSHIKLEKGKVKHCAQFFRQIDELNEMRRKEDVDQFSDKIFSDISFLPSLKNALQEYERLVKETYLGVDPGLLDWIADKAFGNVAKIATEKRDKELSNQIALLQLKCFEIIILSKNNSSENSTNYFDIVRILNDARKTGLQTTPYGEPYYENYELYLRQSIELGEQWLKENTDKHTYYFNYLSSLAASYYLVGGLNYEHLQFENSQKYFSISVEYFRKMGNEIYTDDFRIKDNGSRFISALIMIRKIDEAETEYKKLLSLSIDPRTKFNLAFTIACVYQSLNIISKAKEYYYYSISFDPNSIAAYDKLVAIERSQNNLDSAVELQKKILLLGEGQASKKETDWHYFRLAVLHEEQGDIDNAIKTYEYILENRQPDHREVLDRLSALLVQTGRQQEALLVLQKKLEVTGSSMWLYCRIGDCYQALGDSENTEKNYKQANDLDPYSLAPLQRLAKYYELKGEWNTAMSYVIQLLDYTNGTNQWGHYKWLGDLYKKQNDVTLARKAYIHSLEFDPENEGVLERLAEIGSFTTPEESLDAQIGRLENKLFNTSNNPEIATRLVHRYLLRKEPNDLLRAEDLLIAQKTSYLPDSYQYLNTLTLIYEQQLNIAKAIELREKINRITTFNNIEKISNLVSLVKLIQKSNLKKKQQLTNNKIKQIENEITQLFDDADSIDYDTRNKEILYHRESFYFLAEYFYKQGRYSNAEKYILILFKCSEPTVQYDKVYLQKKAEIYLEIPGRSNEAEKVLKQILRDEGEDSYALTTLAEICSNHNKFTEAIEYLERAYSVVEDRIKYKIADQIGRTYRNWSKYVKKQNHLEFAREVKLKTIEWYKKQPKKDQRLLYGFAKAYLLEPASNEEVLKGISIFKNIFSRNLRAVYKNDAKLDVEILKELIQLWIDGKNDTIGKILRRDTKYFQNIDASTRNYVIQKIIEVSKRENLFNDKIISIFRVLLNTFSNKEIRKNLYQYFIRKLIHNSFAGRKFSKIKDESQKILIAIKSHAFISKDIETQRKQYINELVICLGAERDAYFKILNTLIQEDIQEITKIVLGIDENSIHNLKQTIEELSNKIDRLNSKLNHIHLLPTGETIDLIKELKGKDEHYKYASGLEFTLDVGKSSGIKIHKNIWNKIDDLFLEVLNILQSCNGTMTIKLIRVNNRSALTMIAFVSKVDWSEEILNNLRKKLKKESSNIFAQSEFNESGFILKVFLEEKAVDIAYPEVFSFLVKKYLYSTNLKFWEELNSKIEQEIKIDDPQLMFKVENLLIAIISQLIQSSKQLISRFLNIPHELKQFSKGVEISEHRLKERVTTLRNEFQTFSEIYKTYLTTGTEPDNISLQESVQSVLSSYKHDFEPRLGYTFDIDVENISDSFYGYKDEIEAVFRNLLRNSCDALKRKAKNGAQIEPGIIIRLKQDHTISGKYQIIYTDNGPGFGKNETINNLIDQGNGWGLKIIQGIVEGRYGGKFEIMENNVVNYSGATFLVEIESLKKEAQL